MGKMDEEEEMAAPEEEPENPPQNTQLTMPAEGEIYIPEEVADIHAESTHYESLESEQTSVVTTTETIETTYQTVEYETEAITMEEVEMYEREEHSYAEEDVPVSYEGDDAYHQEEDVSNKVREEEEMLAQDVESTSEMDVVQSSEASEVTAVEISRRSESEIVQETDGISRVIQEEIVVEEPPKPKEEPFKFDVVVKSKGEGKTEMDISLTKTMGLLWGFKVSGGRDLDIPPEVKEVHKGSIADKAGIKVEDMIVAVNDANILELCHHHMCKTILDSGDKLKLGILRSWSETRRPAVLGIPGGCPTCPSCQILIAALVPKKEPMPDLVSEKEPMPEGEGNNPELEEESILIDDPNVSIQIKEAYKKVHVQVTEEYQLVDNDPTALGVNIRESEDGEFAVIIRGNVLDDDEVPVVTMSKKYHNEVRTGPDNENQTELPAIEDAKVAETEGMGSGLNGETVNPDPVMWVANVSASSTTPEPTSLQDGPPIFPSAPVPEKEPSPEKEPAPEPEPPVENKAIENTMPEESDTGVVPPMPPGLAGDYEPVVPDEDEKARELIIGKIHYVPPAERGYSKCYFYKPKDKALKKTNWPPKSNVSVVIKKPRVLREDEVGKPMRPPPIPPPRRHRSRTRSPAPQPKETETVAATTETHLTPESANQGAPTSEPQESQPVQDKPQEVSSETKEEVPTVKEEVPPVKEEVPPVTETPQATPQENSELPSGAVETKPVAEGESSVVTSTDAAPQPSDNQTDGSPAVATESLPAPDTTEPQEAKAEQSAEPAPEQPSA